MEGVNYEDLVAAADASYDHDPAAAALISELDRKKSSRSLAIPTADEQVREWLKRLGEPRTLFGERREDRRDRLRHLVSLRTANGAGPAVSESEDQSSEVSPLGHSDPKCVDGSRRRTKSSTPKAVCGCWTLAAIWPGLRCVGTNPKSLIDEVLIDA
jgi:U4/U6 small nuclear ribonucleoprotein PRP4